MRKIAVITRTESAATLCQLLTRAGRSFQCLSLPEGNYEISVKADDDVIPTAFLDFPRIYQFFEPDAPAGAC